MAKSRKTVDNDHLTLVVRKRLAGFARNVQLVANYQEGIEEVVMSTENYYDHNSAVDKAELLGRQLGIKRVEVEL